MTNRGSEGGCADDGGVRGVRQNPGGSASGRASRPSSARAAAAGASLRPPAAGLATRRARPQSAAPQLYHTVAAPTVRAVSMAPAAALPMGAVKRQLQQLESDIRVVRGLQ
jgi:hypothetical protein